MMGGTIKQASTWFSGNSLHSGSCAGFRPVELNEIVKEKTKEDLNVQFVGPCWGECGRDAS